MTNGYVSLRELEDSCKVNLRFMYLMDHEVPSYRTFGYFINEILSESIEKLFCDINQKIFEKDIRTCNIYILTVLSLKPTQTSIPGYGRKRLKNPDTACLSKITSCFRKLILSFNTRG
ncbi:MAG: transposase [Eubacteriales bacterium]